MHLYYFKNSPFYIKNKFISINYVYIYIRTQSFTALFFYIFSKYMKDMTVTENNYRVTEMNSLINSSENNRI